MSIEVPLIGGGVSLIDSEDAGLLQGRNWRLHSNGRYAFAVYYDNSLRTNRFLLLHRVILGLTDRGLQVDHINGDGLDNQRSNLRVVTQFQNMANAKKKSHSQFKYKGITAGPNGRRLGYCASICVDGIRHYLGTHPTQEAAARAYDAAAVRLRGEFALLNFPLDS